MKISIERRLSSLETKANPPKRRIETFLDYVNWASEVPIDLSVELAEWITELSERCENEGRA